MSTTPVVLVCCVLKSEFARDFHELVTTGGATTVELHIRVEDGKVVWAYHDDDPEVFSGANDFVHERSPFLVRVYL